MAKFGLFQAAGQKPIQEYEGDFIKYSGDIVTFMKETDKGDRVVGIVKLDVNQSIKQIQP